MTFRRVNMREKVSVGLMLLVLVYLMVQLSGCTLIGMGLGSAGDHETSPFKTVSAPDIAGVSPGKKVSITLRSGNSVEGTFLRLYSLNWDEYALIYPKDEKLGTGALRLPRLGEKLIVTEASGKTSEWEFNGFDLGERVSLRRPASYPTVPKPLAEIRGLQDARGEFYDLPFIRTSVKNGLVPFLTAFWLYSKKAKVIIPSDQILEIRMEKSKNGWLIGMAIGLALDITFLAFGKHLFGPPATLGSF